MADRNYLLATWDDGSKAYQANVELSELANAGGVGLLGSAVITRDEQGHLQIKDATENTVGLASLGGGGIGALLGVIGGPLGVLLGFTGGALVGSAFDWDRADSIDSALGQLSSRVPAGSTALVAEVEEGSPAAVDELITKLDGTLDRKDAEEVDSELAEAEAAAEAAADAAAKAVRDRKREERKENLKERVSALRDRFTGASSS